MTVIIIMSIAVGLFFIGMIIMLIRTKDSCEEQRNIVRFHCRTMHELDGSDEAKCLDRWKLRNPKCWENES